MPSQSLTVKINDKVHTFNSDNYRWLWRDDPNRLFGNVDPGAIISGKLPFYCIEIENIFNGVKVQVLSEGNVVYEDGPAGPTAGPAGFWYNPNNYPVVP